MNGSDTSHITVNHKYTTTEVKYSKSYNFTTVKLSDGVFMGLIVNGEYTHLVVGDNADGKGINIKY